MKIVAHIDVGGQIDNSWNKDTALAIKIGNIGFSIKIRVIHKKIIKKKFIKKEKDRITLRNNRRIAVVLHSLLIYKLLDEYQEHCDIIKICGDMGGFSNILRYYQRICKYYSKIPDVKIEPKKGKQKSRAHNLANDVYSGRKKENILIKEKDLKEIINLIEEIYK